MKKTSRRSFGKQLAGAVAALPIVSSAIEAQRPEKNKTDAQKIQPKIFREHDTPPPTFLTPGSLIIEASTNKNDWQNFQTVSNRRKWSVVPKPYPNGMQPANIFIAHLKIVDGAGEMVFRFDNDGTVDTANLIKVTATLKKNGSSFGDCILTTAGDHFELDVPDLKKIKKKNNDPSTNPTLRQRVRYMHDNDDEDYVWTDLRIDKGAVNLFYNDALTDLPAYNDLRVMVWWENR